MKKNKFIEELKKSEAIIEKQIEEYIEVLPQLNRFALLERTDETFQFHIIKNANYQDNISLNAFLKRTLNHNLDNNFSDKRSFSYWYNWIAPFGLNVLAPVTYSSIEEFYEHVKYNPKEKTLNNIKLSSGKRWERRRREATEGNDNANK